MNINIFSTLLNLCAIISIIIGIVKLVTASKRGHGKSDKIKTVITSALLVVVFLFAASGVNGESEINGDYIKAQHPIDVPDITYGQAIDNVCGNQKWSRVTSEYSSSGQAIVQMDADCNYGNEDHKITIQFSFGVRDFVQINANTPFEITFVGFDDAQETPLSTMQDLMYEMFSHYANTSGIILDESARDSILYSEGY